MRRKDQDRKRGGFERSLRSEPYSRRHVNLDYFDEDDEQYDDYLDDF